MWFVFFAYSEEAPERSLTAPLALLCAGPQRLRLHGPRVPGRAPTVQRVLLQTHAQTGVSSGPRSSHSTVEISIYSVLFRVPTHAGKPGNPGKSLTSFSFMENILKTRKKRSNVSSC